MISSNIVNKLSELNKRGQAHFEKREIPEALACFDQAAAYGADPETHSAERWCCWMLLGDFERAWQESDRSETSLRGMLPTAGGRVLIRCLRGLGDAIQFLRYARDLRGRCAHVAVQGPARLLPLCHAIPGIDEAIPFDHPLDERGHDLEMECSDLPYLLRATVDTIPYATGYLKVPDERPTIIPAGGDQLKVGIAWAAGSWNPARSLPLGLFEPLTRIPGLSLFSLQRGPEAEQLHRPKLSGFIREAETEEGDIIDTMAAIAALDLVISVDTMVAHLAGAMGRRVWTLLTHSADWRWMLSRPDSPWYKSMSLLRQASPGDWNSVINQAIARLITEVTLAYHRPG